jgi:diguanylate cyclase (GGDEF)-like protein
MISEKEIHYYDYITGLHNRQYLYDKYSKNISEYVVVFLDIDDFQYINDIYGYCFGDKFLKEFSNRLSNLISESGKVFIYNANQFLILLPKLNIRIFNDEIELLFEKLNGITIVEEKEITCFVSMGIYITKNDDVLDDALRKAEVAMYEVKRNNKGQYRYFDEKIEKAIFRKVAIINGLRKSIINNELYLVYQPILSLKENKIFEVEALLRWENRELGEVFPMEFIPVAEEIGFIHEIGYWIIREVCNQIKKWEIQNINLKVAINISPNQFDDKNFLNNLKGIVIDEGVDFNKIKFEITETQILKSEKKYIKKIKELKKLGTSISLDDFGVGYSSLKNIAFIPISELKIDKSFIDYISISKKIEKLIYSIIYVAHEVGYKVTAEGVERKEQLDKLLELGCDKIQGYYIGKPMKENDIVEFLNEITVYDNLKKEGSSHVLLG